MAQICAVAIRLPSTFEEGKPRAEPLRRRDSERNFSTLILWNSASLRLGARFRGSMRATPCVKISLALNTELLKAITTRTLLEPGIAFDCSHSCAAHSHGVIQERRFMQRNLGQKIGFALLAVIASAPICALRAASTPVVFNVKDYGATGQKRDNARAAIQNTIEAAAKAGGGTVYVPAGDYTTGTLHLRNHIRLFLDAGATLWATKDAKEYDAPSLIYAKDVDNITVDGRGTIDGQAEYVWRLTDHDDAYIRDNQLLAKAMGVPLMRSFPAGDAEHGFFPRMIHLVRCKDVRIAGISILHSPSWNINPYACERMVIDGIYIYSSPKEAVWADGIDPDGCKDLRIMNSTIVTGDDALVFYSSNGWGPALPCENITVTNCRFTSASSALKFCDGIQNCVRNVTIDNCVITAANRGIAFMNFSGGYVENVIISNIVINTQRFDWFWWGNGDPIYFSIRRNPEEEDNRPGTPPAGAIRT